MKKIIAAALSILLGAFGFTITDKKTEERLDDLEASVSSMQEELSNYHTHKTAEPTTTTTTQPDVGTDLPDDSWDDYFVTQS